MIWALHGAVGMAADWREFAAAMPASFGGVRRLDLWRYLDCSPMPLEKFGDALAGEIVRVDPDPVLVGYSMGGRLALHALLAQPGLWKAAVIVSAHPGLGTDAERIERRERDAKWSAFALKKEWPDFLDAWNSQSVLGGEVSMPDRLKLRDRRASVSRSFIDWSLGAQADLVPKLGKIGCPVLWLTGQRDAQYTGIAQHAVANLTQGEHRIIPGCGHRVPWESPGEFSRACLDFLGNALET